MRKITRLGIQLVLAMGQGLIYYKVCVAVLGPPPTDPVFSKQEHAQLSLVDHATYGTLSAAWSLSGVFLISSFLVDRLERLRKPTKDQAGTKKSNSEDDGRVSPTEDPPRRSMQLVLDQLLRVIQIINGMDGPQDPPAAPVRNKPPR